MPGAASGPGGRDIGVRVRHPLGSRGVATVRRTHTLVWAAAGCVAVAWVVGLLGQAAADPGRDGEERGKRGKAASASPGTPGYRSSGTAAVQAPSGKLTVRTTLVPVPGKDGRPPREGQVVVFSLASTQRGVAPQACSDVTGARGEAACTPAVPLGPPGHYTLTVVVQRKTPERIAGGPLKDFLVKTEDGERKDRR